LPFWLSIGCLSLVQAALVAAPRGFRLPALEALRSRWLALVPPLSIALVIGAVALDSASATFLTYLALVAVPPLAALALAALVQGARPSLALLTPPLFAIAWAAEGTLGGHTAALALSALANVTLGWLLAAVVPRRWLELGIYAMAAIDAWLVGSNLLQGPNAVLNTAAPAADLGRAAGGRPDAAAPRRRTGSRAGSGLRLPLLRRRPAAGDGAGRSCPGGAAGDGSPSSQT